MYTCRFNKYMKNLVRDASHPEAHLAKSAMHDAAARYMNLASSDYDFCSDPGHSCVLSVPKRNQFPTDDELADLRWLGCEVDDFLMKFYAVAYIMGTHFRAGEWGKRPRCGSIITCVIDGQSLYARVNRFIAVADSDCPGYASVTWFGKPEYPEGTPLVVKVSEDGSDVQETYGSVVRITQIDPSRVMLEYDVQPHDYYVMRDSGFDTVRML